jgi:hypothetical protein
MWQSLLDKPGDAERWAVQACSGAQCFHRRR